MKDFFVPITSSSHHFAPIPTSTGIAEEEEWQFNQAFPVEWEDTFFDSEEHIVAVFDFDYPLMEAYQVKLLWLSNIIGHLWIFATFLPLAMQFFHVIVPFATFMIVNVTVNGCFIKKRAQWDVYSQHLCITRDGINYVRDKRKSSFGWPSSDLGKTTQMIPLDKITNVNIMEPAGYTCCCIRSTLTTVTVSTSSSGEKCSTLVLCGLKEPYKFKSFLMETKHANLNGFMVFAANSPIASNGDVLPTALTKESI